MSKKQSDDDPNTVRAPAPNAPTKPSPAVLAATRTEPDEPIPSSGEKVLVIDDDPAILETMRDVLHEEGYVVWMAHDGLEGLKRLYEMPRVDLILLDLQMPRVSGSEFLEVFNKTPFAMTPVVVISAFRPAPGLFDERFAFMGKPLDLDTLLKTVRSNIDAARVFRSR